MHCITWIRRGLRSNFLLFVRWTKRHPRRRESTPIRYDCRRNGRRKIHFRRFEPECTSHVLVCGPFARPLDPQTWSSSTANRSSSTIPSSRCCACTRFRRIGHDFVSSTFSFHHRSNRVRCAPSSCHPTFVLGFTTVFFSRSAFASQPEWTRPLADSFASQPCSF